MLEVENYIYPPSLSFVLQIIGLCRSIECWISSFMEVLQGWQLMIFLRFLFGHVLGDKYCGLFWHYVMDYNLDNLLWRLDYAVMFILNEKKVS